MDIISPNKSRQDIFNLAAEINSKPLHFKVFPNINEIMSMKLIDDEIFIYSRMFKAKGCIDDGNNRILLKVKFRLPLKIVGILIPLFISLFLFVPRVQINGGSNPSFVDRAIFVLVGFSFLVIPYVIIFGLKKDFAKNVIRLLTNKTVANSG